MEKETAVITGTSKGIGRAIALLLLENDFNVVGWGRTNTIDDPSFHFIPTDITKEEEVKSAATQTLEKFGAVDILVNNAGLGFEADLDQTDSDQWRLMFDTNVHGLFYCSKAVIPSMKAREKGYIFNIASIAGQTGIQGMSGYCGTKFAVKGISQSMYKELRNHGIKVTCIYPGSVQTNFFDSIPSVTVNDSMMQPEDIALTILHCINSSPNFHHVDIEVRPLRPRKS